MNTSDLAERVATEHGLTKTTAEAEVESVLKGIDVI